MRVKVYDLYWGSNLVPQVEKKLIARGVSSVAEVVTLVNAYFEKQGVTKPPYYREHIRLDGTVVLDYGSHTSRYFLVPVKEGAGSKKGR